MGYLVFVDGNSMRLILDARASNGLFIDPPPVTLPTPEMFSELIIPLDDNSGKSETLYVGKVDIDNYYHRLRVPDSWTPYFAIPHVRAGDIDLSGYDPDAIVYC